MHEERTDDRADAGDTDEHVLDPEWMAWYRLTPAERWAETSRLWAIYLALGGTLDPEPDPQSPFFDDEDWRELFADGRAGVRSVRRSGV
jgi:hypothetical protein